MKSYDKFRNSEWLRSKYWDDGLTLKQIADQVGCHKKTVLSWMEKFGIERHPSRQANNAKEGLVYREESWLRARYWDDGWTMEEMAEAGGCSSPAIHYWMKVHGIKRRRSHPHSRKDGCAVCGTPLPPYRRRYCDDSCCEIGHRQLDRARAKRLLAASDTQCEYCGQPLTIYQEKRGNRFCTVQCWAMSRATLKGSIRQCVICGKKFEPTYEGQACCDTTCGSIKARRTEKERGIETEELVCSRCGEPFEAPKYTGAVGWTMCPPCRREWDRERCRQRRVTKTELIVEEVIDHEVFERDHWICQLCGEPVEPECQWPDSLSPSIDHIVPLSKGGEHSMNNVQLAHLGCNCRKNNSLEWEYEGQEAKADHAQKA